MFKTLNYKRVYRTINEKNLLHNINEINNFKNQSSEIMAVVKADAYGHGSVKISKILENNGVKIFAVATLEEAVELRKNKIKGEILILGYTNIEHINTLIKYNLIQTIVNYEYAEAISALNLKKSLKCHIKINTGMNRLGEEYYNITKIKKMYDMKSLNVLGIFSHLAVADSQKREDIDFTYKQIERFDACIKHLETLNIDVKKKHLQGSYGLINYPELEYDYIRMGIMLYGVKSDLDDEVPLNLKPVLSLCSRITQIRTINPGDCVSYGCDFVANKTMKVATVSIGYGDGLSRSLSNTNYEVMVNNHPCTIIGRICMDQLMIDVSHISNVQREDEVIIFGEHNTVEVLAKHQNSITNEVLTSLTSRIEH